MKTTSKSTNGQGKNTASDGKAGQPHNAPLLKAYIGKDPPISINPVALQPANWDQLLHECNKTAKQIVFKVVALPRWPEDARYPFCSICRELGTRCRVKIRGIAYNDPFDAVLAAMTGPKLMEAHRQTYRAAVEAAAVFHGDMPDAAAKRINDRLAEVSGVKVNHPGLVKQIREMVDNGESDGPIDAYAAAQGFLEHLDEAAGEDNADDGQPRLRYYQEDFYTWTGKAWKPQQDKSFQAQVMAFLQTLEIPKLTERFAKDVIANLKGMVNYKCWDEPMPFFVAEEDPLTIERPRLLVFNNGMVDLDDLIAGKVKKVAPISSRYFNDIVMPYDFDPKAKCPLWVDTLKDILPRTSKSDNRVRVFQEFMGYSLLQDCRFQKMLAMIGKGGNGKTTVVKIWQAMLGEANFSAVPLEVLGDEYRQHSLQRKLVNFSAEFPYLGRVHEGMLKSLVSGEEIEVNRKFKSPVMIRPFAKLVIHANELPQIYDPTEGTWDRLITILFDVRIRETNQDDKNRVEKLKQELSAIFNWAIAGLKRLLEQGHFTACAKCQAFLGEHRTESDTVRLFVAECCQVEKDWVTFSIPLYQFYKFFCTATGRKPVSDSEFGKRMAQLSWKKERETSGTRRLYFKGMSLSQTGVNYCHELPDKIIGGPICRHKSQMVDPQTDG